MLRHFFTFFSIFFYCGFAPAAQPITKLDFCPNQVAALITTSGQLGDDLTKNLIDLHPRGTEADFRFEDVTTDAGRTEVKFTGGAKSVFLAKGSPEIDRQIEIVLEGKPIVLTAFVAREKKGGVKGKASGDDADTSAKKKRGYFGKKTIFVGFFLEGETVRRVAALVSLVREQKDDEVAPEFYRGAKLSIYSYAEPLTKTEQAILSAAQNPAESD